MPLPPHRQGPGNPSSPKPHLHHVPHMHTRVVGATSRAVASSRLYVASLSLHSETSCSFDFLSITYTRTFAVIEKLTSLQNSIFPSANMHLGVLGGKKPTTVHWWPMTKWATSLQGPFRFI